MIKDELYLVKYREAIRKGDIIAGQELTMELDRLISDLDNPRYTYDRTDALARIDFMENCIKLTKSPFYGKPMILMLWQKALIEAAYSFKMSASGLNRFKKIVLLIARKNTKSETCSALGLTEAILGPPGADIVCSSNDVNLYLCRGHGDLLFWWVSFLWHRNWIYSCCSVLIKLIRG